MHFMILTVKLRVITKYILSPCTLTSKPIPNSFKTFSSFILISVNCTPFGWYCLVKWSFMQFIKMFFILDLCYSGTWNKRKNKIHKTYEQKKSVGVATKQKKNEIRFTYQVKEFSIYKQTKHNTNFCNVLKYNCSKVIIGILVCNVWTALLYKFAEPFQSEAPRVSGFEFLNVQIIFFPQPMIPNDKESELTHSQNPNSKSRQPLLWLQDVSPCDTTTISILSYYQQLGDIYDF